MSKKLANGITVPENKEWQSKDLSLNYVADYKPFVMVDGPGIRCAIYLSGCKFLCPGCYNVAAQNFHYGTAYTQELEDQIIDDLSNPYIQGLTLLGGEPFLNTTVALQLTRRVRSEFGNQKDIWSWTGYTWEELMLESKDKLELLNEIDVLVDGRFIQGLMDLTLRFKGSSNQRIIDVPASLRQKSIVNWSDEYSNNEKRQLID